MQDRYVGDIGDYVKLAFLRAIRGSRTLGVLWWHFPDETHNGDGRHIGYLQDAARWRHLDPVLFDSLRDVIEAGSRRISALQTADILPGAIFYDVPVPVIGKSADRRLARSLWFAGTLAKTADCDLIFLDPDNGFEAKHFNEGAPKAGKSVSLAELSALKSHNRTLVVYHHQSRMAGGHHFEIAHWAERLRGVGFETIDVLRAANYSARAFFMLNASSAEREASEMFAAKWRNHKVTWHPDPNG